MKHATQVRLIREAFAAIERRRPPLGETFTENAPDAYVSPSRAEREREVLFRRQPLVVAFSCQLREAGDFVTDDLAPAPILVVRGADGVVRAFANVCRHRGSKLVEGSGRGARDFTCPYHAWSYDLAGRLRSIPEDYGFEGLDRATSGLIEFPVEERYGLVWVLPTVGAEFSVDEHLSGLQEDLASYEIGTYELVESRVLERRINWKLASDTFWEAYHIKVLHRENVAPLFTRNLALFEPFGRNHRYVGIRRSIEKLRDVPESEWDLLPHATVLMNLFPNTVLVMQSDHFEAYRIFPDPERVNSCKVDIRILAPSATAEDAARWKRVMDLLVGVVEQDFSIGEGIQRNFDRGLPGRVVYGRFENALEHFHRSVREAIGTSITNVRPPSG